MWAAGSESCALLVAGWGVLTAGDAVHVWGRAEYRKGLLLPLTLAMEPKTAMELKTVLEKLHKTESGVLLSPSSSRRCRCRCFGLSALMEPKGSNDSFSGRVPLALVETFSAIPGTEKSAARWLRVSVRDGQCRHHRSHVI